VQPVGQPRADRPVEPVAALDEARAASVTT
jgi:hypothetical protein